MSYYHELEREYAELKTEKEKLEADVREQEFFHKGYFNRCEQLMAELEQYKRALELACRKYNSGHTKPYQIYPEDYLQQANAGGDAK